MKIAVCIFGQPRFYKESGESFRKEYFDLPGHEVDIFMHCWDEIGYTPKDDINNSNKKHNSEKLKDELFNLYQPKGILVESPEGSFSETARSLAKTIFTVRDSKLYEDKDWRKCLGKKRVKTFSSGDDAKTSIRIANEKILYYEMGQFYSLDQAMNLKAWYEKENNFKYDLVIRVRTDAFFRPVEIYPSEEEYYLEKENYYTKLHKNCEGKGVMCHGLQVICDQSHPDSSGMKISLEKINFEGGEVAEVILKDKEVNIFPDSFLDPNGHSSFPWRLHIKDWIIYADSETADRVWAGMLSTYIALVSNDIVRFMGNKQIGLMPGGEVVNGAAALLNNSCLHRQPLQGRCLKIVHPNESMRKSGFKGKHLSSKKLGIIRDGSVISMGSHQDMVDRILEWVEKK